MTTTATAKVTISKIEDREGDGTCGACGREGLRWIAVLSDGSQVGLECSKKVMGFRPSPSSYKWVADFDVIAERTECRVTYVLWQHKVGTQTRQTDNGSLCIIGGARGEWERRGWL